MEAFHFFASYCEKTRTTTLVELQFLREYVREEPQAILRPSVIDVTIDFIFIYTFGQKMSNDDENLWIVGRIRETSGVCHHSTIDAGRRISAHLVKSAQLINKFEH